MNFESHVLNEFMLAPLHIEQVARQVQVNTSALGFNKFANFEIFENFKSARVSSVPAVCSDQLNDHSQLLMIEHVDCMHMASAGVHTLSQKQMISASASTPGTM